MSFAQLSVLQLYIVSNMRESIESELVFSDKQAHRMLCLICNIISMKRCIADFQL